MMHDLIHTRLDVSFDWLNRQLLGSAEITLKPHFYPQEMLYLDARGMKINEVKLMNGTSKSDLSYDYRNDSICIKLDRVYTARDTFKIYVNYISRPETLKKGGSQAITDDKGLYFINADGKDPKKPTQVWTQGETQSSSVWFPTIDAPNMKSTQEILLTVDNKYTTLSNGKLISSKKNNDGTRTDYWKQDLPHAPYLFMLAVGEFKVVKDTYTRGDGKKIEVNYYVEPEYEKDARAIFGKTPKMIKFFSEKLGVEYPWDKYSEIVVRDYVSGAMENTGAVVFGDYVYKSKRQLIDGNDESTIAHELFHHWFGDLVTCESWSNLPLNESFANYSQYLWDEFEYGIDEADYNAEDEANGYYQSGNYHNLIHFYYNDKEEMFDAHSYNKGGRILHMLRNYLGDEVFFKGLNKYLSSNAYKSAEFHHLRLALEEVSGEDLNWFFNQWFLGKGHPVIFTTQTINPDENTVTMAVQQAQSFDAFKIPVKIALWDKNGKHLHSVLIDSVNQSFTFPFEGKLENLMLDDDQMLLAKVFEDKPIEQFVHQFYNAQRYRSKAIALKRISKSGDPTLNRVLFDALNDPFWGIRSEALNYLENVEPVDVPQLSASLRKIMASEKKSKVRNAALGLVSKIEENDAISIIRKTLNSDSSIMVLGTSLNTIKEIDTIQALSIARELSSSSEIELKVGAAEIMGEYGQEKDQVFIETMVLNSDVKDYNKLRTLLAYAYYVIRKGIPAMKGAPELLTQVKKNGNQYTGWYYDMIIERFLEMLTSEQELINSEIDGLNPQTDSGSINKLNKKKSELSSLYDQLSPLLEPQENKE